VLLSANGISKSFGVDIVLEDITFKIDRRQKCALVGRNGTGKTTLLKILTGLLEPDTGSLQISKGAKVGYLKQEDAVEDGRTVLEEAQSAQAEEIRIKNRLGELEKRLAASPTEEELEEYSLLHEHFIEAEGYSIDHDARTVLLRMGFTEDEFSKPTSVLSGGERTRLALARMLLEEPDLLILDEPTNHLDLQATEWLERWITTYHGAVLMVSHDRTFLENTATSFLDLRHHTIKSYDGGFQQYLKLRAEEDARQTIVAAKQDEEIAKLDEFVRRFMNSQRTAQARGRLKQMNRLVENKVEAPVNERGMAAGFGKAKRSGDLVIECKKLEIGFRKPPLSSGVEGVGGEGTQLFPPLDWTVSWGERWGVIGENGAGKSTLIKTILRDIKPLSGQSRIGSNVDYGYFHQDVTDLDVDMSPLEYLVYEAGMDTAPARNLLGRFLFSGDDVMRPSKTLSGGEKNKLVLAKLTQQNPNLLILDEPTNHLDMDSRQALVEVLREYSGTLVLVSHDRWLLSQVTERILDVRKDGAIVYPGGYGDYRRRKSGDAIVNTQTPVKKPIEKPVAPLLSAREISKEIGKQERLVEDLENQVASNEAELKRVEKALANLPPTADVFDLSRGHQSLTEELSASLSAWEEQSRRLEVLRSQQGVAGPEPGVTFRTAK